MRNGTDLETLLKEIEQKDEIICNLRRELEEAARQNSLLNAQNIELMLKKRRTIEEEEAKTKRLMQEPGQSSVLDAQKYEEMLAEYRQIKEQERKKQMESYELRINELMISVCRYRDLAKMWEQRWQEQQSLVEQGKKGQHDLIIIISLKKVLIANICREIGEYFNETVSEPDVLAKIKLLIQTAKSLQSDGNIYADVLDSLRMSKLDFK